MPTARLSMEGGACCTLALVRARLKSNIASTYYKHVAYAGLRHRDDSVTLLSASGPQWLSLPGPGTALAAQHVSPSLIARLL
jgi:hypothetical protein